MSVIDVETLLAELPGDSPCGEDLEYDPEFGEMERAAVGKEEQQMGDQVIEAEPPDWRAVKSKALGVLKRTKDLRAGVYLTRALLNTDGYAGLRDGLSLLGGYVAQYWENVYPLLDPDDDNDPIMRVNAVEALADRDATLNALAAAPLVAARVLGRFGLHDMQVASGEVTLPEDHEGAAPTTAGIEAAFMEVELDELQAMAGAVDGCVDALQGLEQAFADKVDVTATPNLKDLADMLRAAKAALVEPLQRRGIATEGLPEDGASQGEAAAPGAAVTRVSGEIATREDVVRAIDRICEYYRRYEPSSPVPILLHRAKRLVPKTFLEIISDVAPSGVTDVEYLRGPQDGTEEES